MRSSKFEIYGHANGQFGVRLRAANGEVQHCTEGYPTKAHAKRSIGSLRRNAASAIVVDLTQPKTGGAR